MKGDVSQFRSANANDLSGDDGSLLPVKGEIMAGVIFFY
jgi:hypothetical protein